MAYWGALLAVIALLCVLSAGSSVEAQANPTPTPLPSASAPATNSLFHDDFTTRVDRWHIFDLGNKARLDYSVDDGDLQVMASAPGYLLWTVPDSDLLLDQAAITLQADWQDGAPDAQFGLIFDYHNDNNFLAAMVSRAGQISVGRYVFGVWKALAPPQSLTLPTGSAAADWPLTLQARLIGTGLTRQLQLTVNGQAATVITIPSVQAGGFGFVAQNGASGTISLALHDYQINAVNRTP